MDVQVTLHTPLSSKVAFETIKRTAEATISYDDEFLISTSTRSLLAANLQRFKNAQNNAVERNTVDYKSPVEIMKLFPLLKIIMGNNYHTFDVYKCYRIGTHELVIDHKDGRQFTTLLIAVFKSFLCAGMKETVKYLGIPMIVVEAFSPALRGTPGAEPDTKAANSLCHRLDWQCFLYPGCDVALSFASRCPEVDVLRDLDTFELESATATFALSEFEVTREWTPPYIPIPVYHTLLELFGGFPNGLSSLQLPLVQTALSDLQTSKQGRNAFHNDATISDVRKNILTPLTFPTTDLRSSAVKGCLFYGEPGTGKTVVSRYLSNHAGFRLLFFGTSVELNSRYIGDSEKKLGELFRQARDYPHVPAVIGFEEVDTIACRRSDHTTNHDLGMLNTLLDRLSAPLHKHVVLFCTTNRRSAIDPAFIRPGRIETLVYFGKPSSALSLTLLADAFGARGYVLVQHHINSVVLGAAVASAEAENDCAWFQKLLFNLTGAQIFAVANNTVNHIADTQDRSVSNPSWEEMRSQLVQQVREFVRRNESPELFRIQDNPNIQYTQLKYLFANRHSLNLHFTGRVLCNISSGCILLEIVDGSVYPVWVADQTPQGPGVIHQIAATIVDAFRPTNLTVVDSRQQDIMRDDSLGGAASGMVLETKQAAHNGGIVVFVDMDEITGVTLQRSTQSGISSASSAQGQLAQSGMTETTQLLREQAFHKTLAFASSCAFVDDDDDDDSLPSGENKQQFCVSFVVTSNPFTASRIEQSWKLQCDQNLTTLYCPKNVHASERYAAIDCKDHATAGFLPGSVEIKPGESYFWSLRPTVVSGSVFVGVALAGTVFSEFKWAGDTSCGFQIEAKTITTAYTSIGDNKAVNSKYDTSVNSGVLFGLFLQRDNCTDCHPFGSLHLLRFQSCLWEHVASVPLSKPTDLRMVFGVQKEQSAFQLIDCKRVSDQMFDFSNLIGTICDKVTVKLTKRQCHTEPESVRGVVTARSLTSGHKTVISSEVVQHGTTKFYLIYLDNVFTDGMSLGIIEDQENTALLAAAQVSNVDTCKGFYGIALNEKNKTLICRGNHRRLEARAHVQMAPSYTGRWVGLLVDLDPSSANYLTLSLSWSNSRVDKGRDIDSLTHICRLQALPADMNFRVAFSLHSIGDTVSWQQNRNIPEFYSAVPPGAFSYRQYQYSGESGRFGTGLFAALGARGNPHDLGFVMCTRSSSLTGAAADFVKTVLTADTQTADEPFSWMQVDLGMHTSMVVTDYCLRSSCAEKHLRNWDLQGSHDAQTWTLLSRRQNDHKLVDGTAGATGHWSVPTQPHHSRHGYRYFRILITGANSSGNHHLAASNIELFGTAKCSDLCVQGQPLPYGGAGLFSTLGAGRNPHALGLVNVTASNDGDFSTFVGTVRASLFTTGADAWICVDLGVNGSMQVTEYVCFKFVANANHNLYPMNWNLEGSQDKLAWSALFAHRGDTTLNGGVNCQAKWTLPVNDTTAKSYRYFRIIDKGVNSYITRQLMISGIELYGVSWKSGTMPEKVSSSTLLHETVCAHPSRGLFATIGTIINPHNRGLVVCTRSSCLIGTPSDLVCSRHSMTASSTTNQPNAWMSVDLGVSHLMEVTHYSFQSRAEDRPLHWQFQGSLDANIWCVLGAHDQETEFSLAWATEFNPGKYRHFRIVQTGTNVAGNEILSLWALELYGTYSCYDVVYG